jgi:hypothetical protein
MMPTQNIQPDPAFTKPELAIDEWDKLPAVFDDARSESGTWARIRTRGSEP